MGRFSSMAAGFGVGLALGVMFAPQAGARTRRYVRERAGQSKDYVRRSAGHIRDRAESLRGRGGSHESAGRDRETETLEDERMRGTSTAPYTEPYGDGM